jgi:hypothetical protein
MSDFFSEIERELCAAAARGAHLRWYQRPGRRGPLALLTRLRIALVALVLAGTGTAVALAATGVILTGSPVRTLERPNAIAGQGMPVGGGSRLLSLSVPDPAGGLPWGMRIVHTTRGLVCVQIGRLEHGKLGELGVDGAFHDDGLFHPLPADALPDVLAPGESWDSDCELPQETYAGDIVGLELSAASDPPPGVGPLADRREISFGLLGRHAVSITYRSGSHTRTQRVLPGLGAYLIVQRYTSARRLGGMSATAGSETSDMFPASPNGALTAITYRYGELCTDTGSGPITRECGISEAPPPHPRALASVHTALHAHLQIHGDLITGAEITFAAPYSVTSAGEDYFLSARTCGGGLGGGGFNRDVARGATVTIPIGQLLSLTCGPSVKIEVSYTRSNTDIPATTPVGTITVHEPAGTHPRPASSPRRAAGRLRRPGPPR